VKTASKINLVLLAGVAILWSALQWPRDDGADPLLFDQRIEQISIVHAAQVHDYVRDQCGWMQVRPQQVRAKTDALERLAGLARAQVHRRYGAGELDIARLGFKPDERISLDGQAFQFGALEPINQWRYLRAEDGSIALITDRYSDLLRADLSASDNTPCPDA